MVDCKLGESDKENNMGHIQTAVGMFNAGEVLREYFRGHEIGTPDERTRRLSAVIPMMVVYILGIEVGIKALVEMQGQKPPRTHDLKKLYFKLETTKQDRIKDRLEAQGIDSSRAENILSYHWNSFEKWRYMGDSGDALVVEPATIRSYSQGNHRYTYRTIRNGDIENGGGF